MTSPAEAQRSLQFPIGHDPEISRKVRAEFMQGLRAADADGAELHASRDFTDEFRQRFAPAGLVPDDLADAMTAYWIVMWCLIHQREMPSPEVVAVAREQIAAMVRMNPQVRAGDAAYMQMVGEGLVLETAFAVQQWRAAVEQNDGDSLRVMAEAAATNSRRKGLKLGRMTLDHRGFVQQPK